MKPFIRKIKPWFCPKPDKAVTREIDLLNLKTVCYVSAVICVIQTITLTVFLLTKLGEIGERDNTNAVVSVSACILLCAVGALVARRYLKREDASHTAISVFTDSFVILLLLWSMTASIPPLMRGHQVITFFVVELMAVVFLRLHPLFSTVVIACTYLGFFLVVELWIRPGTIHPYNFFMMGALSIAGSIIVYRITRSAIEQKNRAKMLNDSLEIIANHDPATRLQNRYALNQRIPDYLNTDICLALGDINRFKAVNDTYGHSVGDKVLEAFSNILRGHFDAGEVYRYGGDEFLIVTASSDLDALRSKLDQMNRAFGAVRLAGVDGGFSCSFGSVSARPQSPSEFFDLIRLADDRLYDAKARLKSRQG